MIRFIFVLLAYFSLVQICQAAPVLKKGIFEFNSRVKVQEEFLILTSDTVSDSLYSLSELRIQLNATKTYTDIGFYDKVNTTYGQAVAYNTLDVRWLKFKNKLLYFADTTASASKYEVIPFRVVNPAGEVSDWGQIRISLGGQYDQKYDYYPRDDIASAFASQTVDINVLQNDPNVQIYYKVEIYTTAAHGTVSVNTNKTIKYTPAVGFTGQDKFSYRIAGNNLYDVYSAAATVTVNIQSQNKPPQIFGTPDTKAYVGQPYLFTPQANDPDNNTLSFSISNKPGWAIFNTATGSLSGTPTSTGTHPDIVISVSDGVQSVPLPPFAITVEAQAVPKVTRFEWVPSTVQVGEATSFYWDIENVAGCYDVNSTTPTILKPASGSVGPNTYTSAATEITKFYCTDLHGGRFPQDPDQFLQASRTVLALLPKLQNPIISPLAGTYPDAITVTLNSASTETVQIRYTIDGSDVAASSLLYTAPFILPDSATVKAKAFKEGFISSEQISALFEISSIGPVEYIYDENGRLLRTEIKN